MNPNRKLHRLQSREIVSSAPSGSRLLEKGTYRSPILLSSALRRWRQSYSFFTGTYISFLPRLSKQSPVNCSRHKGECKTTISWLMAINHGIFSRMSGSTNCGAISDEFWKWSGMTLFAFSVLLFLSGCRKSSAPISSADTASFRNPTATEVFDLRSKCAELGEKILKNTAIADGLTKDQLSHYEPKTNRCYIQVTVWNANPSKGDDHFQQHLYDGQTGQLLAAARREKGVRSGEISNSPYPLNGNSDELYMDATLYISQMMADDTQH